MVRLFWSSELTADMIQYIDSEYTAVHRTTDISLCLNQNRPDLHSLDHYPINNSGGKEVMNASLFIHIAHTGLGIGQCCVFE